MQQHLLERFLHICGVGLLLTLLYTDSPASAANRIMWTPSVLTMTITPGENRSVDVSFVALCELDYVLVDVAPELQPLVSVAPRILTGISKGQTVHVTITVSVSAPRPAEPITGAIRLFHALHLGVKGGGVKILRWPVPFANPLLLTIRTRSTDVL
jgi:hypothetical protein